MSAAKKIARKIDFYQRIQAVRGNTMMQIPMGREDFFSAAA
jgi:hypothetical protein